jgi:hypothetical protein
MEAIHDERSILVVNYLSKNFLSGERPSLELSRKPSTLVN